MNNQLPKMDAKFEGVITKVKNGAVVGDDEWVLFLVKDDAFFATLPTYLDNCVRLGADNEQIAAVKRMMVRAAEWRLANPERCKVPDASGEKLLEGL